ncbi:MAG: hypothetical protein WED05_10660 [Candidatus Atabeyarchaeum deiterrae]
MPYSGKSRLMQRYSNLFVRCDDQEVQQFYWLLSLFLAKCDGLISAPEVLQLMSGTGAIPFDPYVTPVDRKESLLIRLKFLKKYDIDTPREIIRVLTQGLFSSDKMSPSDRRYLFEFIENPTYTFKQFAGKLSVSVSSVFEAYHRLGKTIRFRFPSLLNFPLLKLKHFVIFFKPNDSFESSMISTRDYTLSMNRDTFGDWMWASFLVPNQVRILKEFRRGLSNLADKSFHDSRLYEVRSYGAHSNISMFDGERWIYSEEALGIGAFKFAERNKEIFTPMDEFLYADTPIRFDDVDFIICCQKIGDSRIKNSAIKEVLRQNGHNLSWVTVSKRVNALKRKGVYHPGFAFYGLGLNLALTFAVECDEEVVETFYHMFPMFPWCAASRTDKGVIFQIRTTAETGPVISYLMQSLKDEVHDLIMANRLENIGTRSPFSLHKQWNSTKQYWEFERGAFDLSKKHQ